MHDRALPQRGMMLSTDLQPYQNGSDRFASILMGPVHQNQAISPPALTAFAIHPVVLLSPTERKHTHTLTEDLSHNRQKIGSVFTSGLDSFKGLKQQVCVCVCVCCLCVLPLFKLMGSVGP